MLSVGLVVTVLGGLVATLLGGGLATRHSDILDGNTWVTAAHDGIERLLRINPGSGEVDVEAPSPLGKGAEPQLEQSNVTTAVVDANSGATFVWDAVGGRWQKSITTVSGRTRLHLSSTGAFTVDAGSGTVQELEPTRLAPLGRPVQLGSAVSDSTVDGSGRLWLALPAAHRVAAVQPGADGPAVQQQFQLPTSGEPLELTALRSGVLATDPAGRSAYRLLPGRGAAERIDGVSAGRGSVSAVSSDDDTGAVLDRDAGRLARVTPAGDQRARSVPLGPGTAGHRLGRPVVFGGRMYVPDYDTGRVLRDTDSGGLESVPPESVHAGKGKFDVFIDDGRLWVNAPDGAKAYSIDPSGHVVPVTKFEPRPIPPPGSTSTPPKPRKPPAPTPTRTTPTPPVRTPEPPSSRPPPPAATPTPTPPRSTTPPEPPKRPTSSPTPVQPPGAPRITAVAPGDGSLTVTWRPPSPPARITGYTVTWLGPDGASRDASVAATARTFTITGLTNGAVYTITVQATGAGGGSPQARATGTPLTTPGPDLRAARATGHGQITVDYGVAENGSGAVSCRILVSGTEVWSGGCGGDGTQVVNGLADDTSYDVTLEVRNAQGAVSSPPRSVRTWGPIRVTISKGGSAIGAGEPPDECTDPSCAWITVHIENGTPGHSYPMSANDTGPVQPSHYPTRSITPDASGQATISGQGQTYFFGYRNRQVWAIIDVNGDGFGGADDIESQHFTW